MSGFRQRTVRSEHAPKALGPYRQAVGISAAEWLFLSGQIGLDPESGNLVSEEVGAQTEQCLRNILAIVKSAGGDGSSIVKATVYLERIEDFPAMNEVYSRVLEPPYPARSCVAGCRLPKGALVEIEAVAALEG